jgi:flavodoxin I
MKALVVFDSFFGNTEKIAHAIGTELGLSDADIIKAGKVRAEQIAGLDLLIVGSPTRAFQASDDIKSFIKSLSPGSLSKTKVAAFDTRIEINEKTPGILKVLVKIFGYAAEPIARRLVRKGGTQVLPPTGFLVLDSEGPLKEGELQKASDWVKPLKNN